MTILISFFIFIYLCSRFVITKSLKYKIFLFLISIFIAFVLPPLIQYFKNLGSDSFLELQKFEIFDAVFFFSTIQSVFFYFKPVKFLNELICLGLVFIFVFKFKFLFKGYIPLLSIIIGVLIFAILNFRAYESNSFFFEKIKKNFDNKFTINNTKDKRKILLVVYIGESTSAAHMHLYGYPRLTTPNLDKNFEKNNLVFFKNVLSTHTHTTPSLLEALSVSYGENILEEIINKKRVSISDLLYSVGIQSQLFSNQGYSGSFNYASPIIFNRTNKNYSSELMLGNNDGRNSKPYDHLYFSKSLEQFFNQYSGDSEVVFLHSYAGHGPYLRYVPEEFKKPVDSLITGSDYKRVSPKINQDSILGVDHYDSAIRYVDHSVSTVFELTSKSDYPVVTLYFSDHGDSPFTGSGHDSSRANIYNFRVPFVLHFNSVAKLKYPEVFKKYQRLSRANSLDTLDKLPTTILDLFDIDSNTLSKELKFPTNFGEANKNYSQGFFVRQTNLGKKYIDLDYKKFNKQNYNDINTGIFIISKQKLDSSLLCMHGANNIEAIVRANAVSNCLEFDLVVNDDHLDIYHPPLENLHLHISDIVNSDSKNKHFWIDAKNANNPNNCMKISKFLSNNNKNFSSAMVEFPSVTNFNDPKIQECLQQLEMSGVEQSFYLDTKAGKECLKESKEGNYFSKSCLTIKNQISVARKANIKNISYDFKLSNLVNSIDNGEDLIKNTWALSPEEIDDSVLKKFKRIIYKNQTIN